MLAKHRAAIGGGSRVLRSIFIGLGALPALGQVVAVLAAEEAPEDGDPQGFGGLVFLRLRVLGDGLLLLFRGGAVVIVSWRGGGHFRGVDVAVVVARGTVVATSWLGAFRVVHRWIVKRPRLSKSGPDLSSSRCVEAVRSNPYFVDKPVLPPS